MESKHECPFTNLGFVMFYRLLTMVGGGEQLFPPVAGRLHRGSKAQAAKTPESFGIGSDNY
jgi:hypothetical protein